MVKSKYHYTLILTHLSYEEAFTIRKYMYDNGYDEDDFEYIDEDLSYADNT